MNPEKFCYWLDGFFTLSEKKELSEKEVTEIKNHLDLALGRNKVQQTNTQYCFPEELSFENFEKIRRRILVTC